MQFYSEVLYHYLLGNVDSLERFVAEPAPLEGAEARIVCELSSLRLQIRKKKLAPQDLETFKSQTQITDLSPLWAGEVHFVLGKAWETLFENNRASAAYYQSHESFEAAKLLRKSVKALMNYVAMESRIRSDQRFIADNFYLARKALQVGEKSVAANAYMNISREYQKLGALSVALKYANEALDLVPDQFGTLHYEHIGVHRCHILFQMGRLAEAQLEFEKAQVSAFSEIRAAAGVVKKALKSAESSAPEAELSPVWKERLAELRVGQESEPLSERESQLLDLLSRQPRTKHELIDLLYPKETAAYLLLEDRVKELIKRLRRKRAQLIIFEDGKYRLSEVIFLSARDRQHA